MDSFTIKAGAALLIVLSQLLAWRYFRVRVKKRWTTFFLNFIYILGNFLGLGATILFLLDIAPNSELIWDFAIRPGLIWELVHVVWLVPAFLILLLKGLWTLFFHREPKGLPKLFREKPGPSLFNLTGLVLILFLFAAFFGYLQIVSKPEVNQVTLTYENLPPELEGFTIAVISDFHLGLGLNPEELKKILKITADLNPQLVVFLGDFVNIKALAANEYKSPLAPLKYVPYGILAVLGNEDLLTDNPENIRLILSAQGIKILSNERLNLHGTPISIVGFEDPGHSFPDFPPQKDALTLPLPNVKGPLPPEGNFVIFLNHRPEGILEANQLEADLFLAGHTYGGIVALPWNKDLNLASLYYTYTSGLYEINPLKVFVTRGVSSPLFSTRLFAWQEIALLTLKSVNRRASDNTRQGR
ncbi:MAG: metallophosphoesterase [Deltaproteobacteria bacterium]|jgi:predicted MPP superfamily phosphohydrolase|nr:metallophosphoesterase [Deltaproteobacteria bacterium]